MKNTGKFEQKKYKPEKYFYKNKQKKQETNILSEKNIHPSGSILCAIRGGEASKRTEEHAINLAKKLGVKLIFIYVIDLNIIKNSDPKISSELKDELTRMGRLLLRIAQVRANKEGVKSEILIGESPFKKAIEECLKSQKAQYLVIGKPKIEDEKTHFSKDSIKEFAQNIKEATGVIVEMV